MNTYNANGGFAAAARTATRSSNYSAARPVALNHGRVSAGTAQDDPLPDLHNARGLVIAIMMSAACWAGLGLAFLL